MFPPMTIFGQLAKEVLIHLVGFQIVMFLKHIVEFTICTTERPCLMIFDNYDSHFSINGLSYATDNGF